MGSKTDKTANVILMKNLIFCTLFINGLVFTTSAQCDPLTIVVLGSSTSFGTGASHQDSSYVGRYSRFLADSVNKDCVIYNLALSGYTSYQIQASGFIPPKKRWKHQPDTLRNITHALSLRPDAILLNFPSNDAGCNFTLQEQKDNFKRVTELADSAGIPYWITSTQPRNFTGDPLANQKKLLLTEMKTILMETYPENYIDFYEGLQSSNGNILPQYNSGDDIHLNDLGHQLLFTRLKNKGIHRLLCE